MLSQRLVGFAVAAAGLMALPLHADVVILKDGYAIHGKVGSEIGVFFDPLTGEQIASNKLGGLNLADDGPRLTAFSAHYKRVGDVDPQNKFAALVQITRPIQYYKSRFPLPPVLDLSSKTEFNEKWQRTLIYSNPAQPRNPYRIEQQIDLLTPHYLRMMSYTHQWASYYLTKEIGPEQVRKLLSMHPDFLEPKGPDGDKRAKLIRFLIQADWLREAEEEIDKLEKALPAEAKRVNEFRETIAETRLDQSLAEIERAKEAGQHGFARRNLANVPKNQANAKTALKVAGLKAEYDALSTKFDKAAQHLKELATLAEPKLFKDLIESAVEIERELHIDSIGRLELFITLADQAATARTAMRLPQHRPEELLSAAICGWLMGNTATETSVTTARKRIKARKMALAYLRDTNSAKRRESYVTYAADADALPFDELEKLISLLPPPDAEKDTGDAAVTKKSGPLPEIVRGVTYLLKLPPEYHHSRSYPLLIILPQGGEEPAVALKRFGDLPAQFGFVIAVLDWSTGFNTSYGGTEEEQMMVTGLVRHLRRTLQIDSDRIFLFGDGQGANFAIDMGATHPDLFAGIIPMIPAPDWQSFRVFQYWKNFQNLPVYMIVGDKAGDAVKTIRSILTEWMPRGYPAIAVSYKGRGYEWFGEELPYVFDWMSRKKRPTAFPELGKTNEEYRTVRASSNRFYWISTDEIEPASLYNPERPARQFNPAKLQARFSEGNQINIYEMGFKQLSIWLGKGTVDFAKPVTVTIANRGAPWRQLLTPRINVLLEDLYERGDRQRPYYQRIDCSNLNGQVKFTAQ